MLLAPISEDLTRLEINLGISYLFFKSNHENQAGISK